ncbi:hypothetical protein B6I21_09375 [candidate division KSB1 bacterium 4572_119]|nr:MAG: hypothetical protein B6I21_09375 [candidate division KSB1 bacterium 4572_119]
MWKNILPGVLILIFIYLLIPEKKISHGPGIIAAQVPQQVNLQNQKSFLHNNFWVTPLAKFSVEARVLSKNWHRFNRYRKIVPVDLALGWGKMSDESILKEFKIYQRGMKYYWSSKTMPIPRKEIISHSANMHIIPANEQIRKKMKKIRRGHHIKIRGYLVKIRGKNGKNWGSSMTRTDWGNGACELVWVEHFEIL